MHDGLGGAPPVVAGLWTGRFLARSWGLTRQSWGRTFSRGAPHRITATHQVEINSELVTSEGLDGTCHRAWVFRRHAMDVVSKRLEHRMNADDAG